MSTAATENVEQAAKKALAAAVGGATIGVTPAPAPELNGLQLQVPQAPPVYLVVNGFRRWVPNPDTYNNLFKSGATIIQDPHAGVVSEGPALTSGAILAKADGRDPIYLLTNGVKMWIPSPAIFDRYQFDWGKVKTLSTVVIDSIPNGPDIEGPHS